MDTKKNVLIVDDVELNRAFLRDMLEDEYRVLEASNGLEALEIIEHLNTEISVVLLDVVMPEMDGFEVLEVMNENDWIDNVPVVMISAETSPEYIERGYQLGVTDYISRPFSSEIVMHRVHNTIFLYTKQNMLKSIVEEQIREQEKNNTLMVDILSTVVEFRNGESGLHVRRIRIITEILLEELSYYYPEYEINSSLIAIISNAAALHDIGKIMISEEILNKPGKLTFEEFEVMKTHAQKGSEMIMNIHGGELDGLLLYAHDICRWHHERWDGRGYPDGLKGNDIPLCAQVVSLADVYDALVSERVYKPAYSKEKALEMILNGECGTFNPRILDCLMSVADVLEEKIYIHSTNYDNLFDTERISKEIISQRRVSISDRTKALLEEERLKYQSFAALSGEILFEYNLETDTINFSDIAAQILDVPLKISHAKQWLNQGFIISVDDYHHMLDKIRETTLKDALVKLQCFAKLPNGQRWIEITLRTLFREGSENTISGCLGKIVDINNQKKEEQKLKLLSEIDSLTQIYNQQAAETKISHLLKISDYIAILFLDIDNFKMINDTRGHQEGDRILKQCSQYIKASIKKNDIVARVGGDEFLVCMQISDKDFMQKEINDFWETLQNYLKLNDLCISMGVSIYPNDTTHYEKLVSYADKALSQSKDSGKNQYCFYDKKLISNNYKFNH